MWGIMERQELNWLQTVWLEQLEKEFDLLRNKLRENLLGVKRRAIIYSKRIVF